MLETFVKLKRSRETEELMKDPPAFLLLTQIAYRANRTDTFNKNNLKPGEAFIGDFKSCGLTRQQYRTAKAKLEKYGFATFRATNKGTIATLTDTRVYDINMQSEQPTKKQSSNQQATTNKKSKEDKNINIPFNDFWNLFDKKQDRHKAELAWLKLTDQEREAAIRAIPGYLTTVKDKQFQKHATTWLNGKCWEEFTGSISNAITFTDPVEEALKMNIDFNIKELAIPILRKYNKETLYPIYLEKFNKMKPHA